jgi:hypothetical protein
VKIRALVNGSVIDVPEERAKALIDAKLFEAVEGSQPEPRKPVRRASKKSETEGA